MPLYIMINLYPIVFDFRAKKCKDRIEVSGVLDINKLPNSKWQLFQLETGFMFWSAVED